jgi:hypothetical protein
MPGQAQSRLQHPECPPAIPATGPRPRPPPAGLRDLSQVLCEASRLLEVAAGESWRRVVMREGTHSRAAVQPSMSGRNDPEPARGQTAVHCPIAVDVQSYRRRRACSPFTKRRGPRCCTHDACRPVTPEVRKEGVSFVASCVPADGLIALHYQNMRWGNLGHEILCGCRHDC